MTAETILIWTKRLEGLKGLSLAIADAARQLAADLQAGLIRIPPELPSQIDHLMNEFSGLRREIADAAAALGFAIPWGESLAEIWELVRQIEREQQRVARQVWSLERDDALSLLAKLERLAHRDMDPFPPLEAVRAQANELRKVIEDAVWPERPPELEAVTRGVHPLARLLRLVEEGHNLPDSEWNELSEAIKSDFPIELATPALRGKLLVLDRKAQEKPRTEAESPIPTQEESSTAILTPPQPSVPKPIEPEPREPVKSDGVADETPPVIEPSRDLYPLIWRLVGGGHCAFAHHLAAHLERTGQAAKSVIPAWLLRAAILGPVICDAHGELAGLLRDDLSQFSPACFEQGTADLKWGIRFLAAAASLRPAILAPQTGAAAVLRQLHLGELPRLFRYCQRVAEFGERNLPVDLAALRGVQDLAAWQAEMEQLRQEAERWWQQAKTFTVKYAPATKVWREWLKKGEFVERLIKPVLDCDEESAAELERALVRCADPREIDRQIRETDRQVLRRPAGSEITAEARLQLHNRVNEAVGYARRWTALINSRRRLNSPDYIRDQAKLLRDDLLSLSPGALADLDEFESAHGSSLPIRSSVAICKRAIESVQSLFRSDMQLAGEPSAWEVLHLELLHVPGLRLTDEGEVIWADFERAIQFLESLADGGRPGWSQTVSRLCEEGLHEAVNRIIETLHASADKRNGSDLKALEELREQSLQRWRERLQTEITATTNKLEDSVAQGLLGEQERGRLASQLEALQQEAAEVFDFPDRLSILRQIEQEIAARREQRLQECRDRLDRDVPADHPLRRRIEELLENGNVLVAHEYIDMIARGLEMPGEKEEQSLFTRFFPAAVRSLEGYLEGTPFSEVIRQVEHRRNFAGLELAPLTGADAKRAAETLEVWFKAKKENQCSEKQVQEILLFLGFRKPEVMPLPEERGRWMRVRTIPLSGREECPIPFFGSAAGGEYRVLCVWERPNVEALLQDVGDKSRQPVIVLFFGRLTEHRRRELGRLCRQRRKTLVVLDDMLLVFLCSFSAVRLRPFFECTLPFTYAEAYVTSAGLVPPEMFFGRQVALQSIQDPQGTCFIYGGRQLGKTALLREAQRRFQTPDQSRLALWLDLKALGIGTQWPLDHLWSVLDQELTKLRLGKAGHPPPTFQTFGQRIKAWLSADPQRRFLLLLDEADRFLAEDAKGPSGKEFIRASQLKGLMDQTDRRFKVVFAGLHDVQRTTTLSNHPLAHYGLPICVGPLLDGGEWREARELIEGPFASLGYRFESPDLVTRILSQTNYYPSLIQLYCQQLHMHLAAHPSARPDWRSGPPFMITAREVEEAYQSKDLRRAIRDRFAWTLQLDPRYEVIAYSIAHEITSSTPRERSRMLVQGFDAPWLQRQALSWWEDGFRTARTVDAFRALLDEMVGLGVLRHVDAARYALRSPNVVALLGTNEEIEAKLLEPRQTELSYEPSIMRAPLLDTPDARRSPLTWQQESVLLFRGGVFVLCGCEAAGLSDCAGRVEQLFPKQIRLLGERSSTYDLSQALRRTPRGEVCVALVSLDAPWDWQWLDTAFEILRRKGEPGNWRAIFLCDPGKLWALSEAVRESLETHLVKRNGHILTLAPWGDSMLQAWLDDCGLAVHAEHVARIREVTGNWPALLYRLQAMAGDHAGRLEEALAELNATLETDQQFRANLCRAFGLIPALPSAVMHWLSLQEGTAEEELVGLLQDQHPAEQIRLALEWGRLLNLITFRARGSLELDPVPRRLAKDLPG